MVIRCAAVQALLIIVLSSSAQAQQVGSIRGMVYDRDFDAPLPEAQVMIAETGQTVKSTPEGNYVIPDVPPGQYTLVFSKQGFTRLVESNVLVSAGQLTEVDAWMSGDFYEMEEFVVQDVQFGGSAEIALLELRMDSPALMDSISSELMSQAGAGDAASALRLVAGAAVQDGKFAVIRGLPDRYVNSQMNGVRLPTADEDKRAVQLDQFPSAAIESIQVTKTFTPDQQGDASGGAVNVVLKGIPEETTFKVSGQWSYNTLSSGIDDFVSYDGGGVDVWGFDGGSRDIQSGNVGGNWDGAVGVTETDAPIDSKWSMSSGGKHEFDNGLKIGGFGSFFYERNTSHFDNGINDKWWVEYPGDPMTPQFTQGTPQDGDFKTELFDVRQSSEEVKWGGLGVFGLEFEKHALQMLYMYTRVTDDEATIAENTRGKEFYFPDYDVNDPNHPGNRERFASPYIRTETLQYTERETQTLQFHGTHELPDPAWEVENIIKTLPPEFKWGFSLNSAGLYQPDKRQFGSLWLAESFSPGFPPFVPPRILPEVHRSFKPAANFTLGNLQRVWKDISEESSQFHLDLKMPFEQWTGDEGYLKTGVFYDEVVREYEQDSFSNFNDDLDRYEGPFDDLWSEQFPLEDHPVTASDIDVDYEGEQNIFAWYYMADVPLTSDVKVIGGARHEHTEISITNFPEDDVTWVPPGSPTSVKLNPGDADVTFEQDDVLPSIGLVVTPWEQLTLRASYTQTVARQTFKELSPIQQQEFLGGDVFIGNPFLEMSSLKNYDLRLDYTPYEGGLISLSYFYKDIKDPIEYVQRIVDFSFTTPVNYPEGTLSGYEVEVRQRLGQLWDKLDGLSVGANATFIDSEVILPDDERAELEAPNIQAPISSRDMTNAPEHLYNFFLTYDIEQTGTQLGLFYTVRGDTLVAGAGQSNGNFVPSVYETEYGSLNFSVTQRLGDTWSMKFQAKNLTDPAIETVYRSEYIGDDVTKSFYKKGMEFSISVSATF